MFLRIISMLMFLVLFVGINVYMSSRFAKFFGLKKKLYLIMGFLAGGFSYPVFMILHSRSSSLIIEILYVVSTLWIGLFLYLLLFLILYELLRLFFKPPLKISGIIIISLAGLVSLYGISNASILRVYPVEISIKGLSKELRIIQLTDIHIGPYRGKKYLDKLVKITNRQKPDLVFITGDLIDGQKSLEGDNLTPLMKIIAPTFFVAGNHENYADINQVYELIDRYKIKILKNEMVEVEGIQLIGLEYMKADNETFDMHSTKGKFTIKEMLETLDISSDTPAILLHHSPVGVKYANLQGIDLMLSGHTHGGQLFPANFFTRIFFSYIKGLYQYKDTCLYVSQGTGTFGPPIRVGTSSEITLITLKGN